MSRRCDVCNKGSQKGKKIAIAWGVKYRSIRHRQPNLRNTTLLIDDEKKKVKVCTTCLKSVKAHKIPNVKAVDYATADKNSKKANLQ